MGPSDQNDTNALLPRRGRACDLCRAKKVRCSGATPCEYCVKHRTACTYAPPRARPRRPPVFADRASQQALKERLDLLEAAFSTRQAAVEGSENMRDSAVFPEASASRADARAPREEEVVDSILPPTPVTTRTSALASATKDSTLLSPASAADELESRGLYSENVYFEYQGPRAWLSFCSKPGVEWVTSKTGDSTFAEVTRHCTQDITRLLKLRDPLPRERVPDPDPDVAWEYSKAYFDGACEAGFGIIIPSWFNARLNAHFRSSQANDEDAAWFALRHTVFAAGAQIVHSQHPSYASPVARSYFSNALSVLSELLLYPTSLLGVQALVVMAYFAETVGTPKLDSPLCMNAAQLAFAKGLHKHPPEAWNLTENEVTHRAWIFWAIYCLEKGIVSRSGRPSMIDDGEVTCRVPSTVHAESGANLAFATALVKIRRLASFANTALWSTKALTRPAVDWITTINDLNQRLGLLVGDLRETIDLYKPISASDLPKDFTLRQAFMIYVAYYMILFDVHTTVVYPWSRGWSAFHSEPAGPALIERSQSVVSQTCRAIMLASSIIPIEPQCPFLIAFYAPLYALINLFIAILHDPSTPSARENSLLMNVGAGYFARLRLVTGSTVCASLISCLLRIADRITQPFLGPELTADLAGNPTPTLVTQCAFKLSRRLDLPEVVDLPYAPEMAYLDLIGNFANIPDDGFEWWDNLFDIEGVGSLFVTS